MTIFQSREDRDMTVTAKILVKETLHCLNYGGIQRRQVYKSFLRMMDAYRYNVLDKPFNKMYKVNVAIDKAHGNCFPKLNRIELNEYVEAALKEDLEGVLPSGCGDLNVVCGFVSNLLIELENQNENNIS